jgi:class 3 adenylate cyclase
VIGRVISPVLVGRQHELSELEDALLSANRGDGRFVLLGGEAGIGKTRLARELARRAQKLGCAVLWGSCSEAELPLPYLPFVEAIGSRLDEQDAEALRAELGPRVTELAQVLPQLREGPPPSVAGDPEAKVRLFEAVVGLLELWARSDTLLIVLDDIHWADGSTRELLEYTARRLAKRRVMLLATYRSDELDRLHPLTRAVQTWRRTLAEVVSVEAMTPSQAGEMIAAGLGAEDVSMELASFMHERSEGNPFVLEELLREAVDRGEAFQVGNRWERRALDSFELPETVREALLLRLGRLDPDHVEVLRSAAILGRSFDYGVLVQVADADESDVLAALETAVAQQLLDEQAEAGRYSWRHALTQEAIVGDMVLPKRMRAHSRAADVFAADSRSSLALARHLLGAGRANEAVAASLRAADEAELASGFSEATELLERILPNVTDERDHGLVLYRMGRLRWLNGEPAAAAQLLEDAVRQLEGLGMSREAAEARVHLSRCYWEMDRPAESLETVEQARETLARDGPSAELALADIRIAGLYAFQLDFEQCRIVSQRGADIAEQAGADFERLWALSFLALGHFGTKLHLQLFAECYEEALAKGYSIIAGNVTHNEIWDRVECLAGGLQDAADRYVEVPFLAWALGVEVSQSWAALARGAPHEALEHARSAWERHSSLGNPKFQWRSRLASAEALLELGRTDEAAEELPPPSPGAELQDIAYDTPARVRIAIAQGRGEEAAELGRRAFSDEHLVRVPQVFALAVEGLLAGGAVDEAAALVERAKELPYEVGEHGRWMSEGRVLLALGRAAEARPLLERAAGAFEEIGLLLWCWRARTAAAEAAGESGDAEAAHELLASVVRGAHAVGAFRIRDDALAAAERVGVEMAELPEEPEAAVQAPNIAGAGERLVTSMFADVRGFTPMATVSAPDDLADRLTTLHRWAAAEVGKRQGIVDKFAGDAVMATFNATGARLDHAMQALDAALALRDKAALMDLPLGIGIAVGPAVVSRSVDEGNVSVLGSTTNLAARLQTAAAGGDILLSDEAYRRVASWLDERGLSAEAEHLELKGFDGAQAAYRLSSPVSG